MFRDFLPFFFSPLYFFLPLIRAPTPFTDLVSQETRKGGDVEYLDRQFLHLFFSSAYQE